MADLTQIHPVTQLALNQGFVSISSKHSSNVSRIPPISIHWSLWRRAHTLHSSLLKYPKRARGTSKNGDNALGAGQAYLVMKIR